MEKENKIRVSLVQEILEKYSDENHPITTNQIVEYLIKDYGMPIHRTTVAKDVAALKNMGVDVQINRSTQNRYFIGSRYFELAELKLLIDAIASSKFISEKKSSLLVKKLDKFASIYQREEIKRNVCAEERIKPANEYSFYISDAINTAINKNKKISFLYYDYDNKKEKQLRNDGKPYKFSPYTLVWNGDYYYVVGFSDKHNKIGTFRVDRIYKIPDILDEEAVEMPNDFNIADFTKTVFQMYDSEHKKVKLRCDNALMKIIIDRFGEQADTRPLDENTFELIAEVSVSPNFFSWLFGFGGEIQITYPDDVKEKYIKMLKNTIDNL